ncbi:MAG: hypothetical protein ACLQFM_18805 [Terriglobales bacterium]
MQVGGKDSVRSGVVRVLAQMARAWGTDFLMDGVAPGSVDGEDDGHLYQ